MKNTNMIKKNYEFKYFFKKGKYFSGELLEIFVFYNKKNTNQLGIVVSKKVGGSVIRNRIKRFIREAYSNIEKDIIKTNNLLIVWKKSVSYEKANYYDIKKDLHSLFKRCGILGKE